VLHWHSGKWSTARTWNLSGGPPGPIKTGITALSPSDVWVFGGNLTSLGGGNGTWHLHGKTWTKVKGPGASIYSASAVSPTEMWGIGGTAADAIVHYSAGSWHTVASPSLHGLQFGRIVATSAGSVWVTASPVGKTGLRLLHLQGGKWTTHRPPWSLPLSTSDGELPVGALSPDGHAGFWLTAYSSNQNSNWLLHFSAGKWTRVSMGRKVVNSIARIPGKAALWATGSAPAPRGAIPYTAAVIWADGTTG
jgi:hypothetical protein